MSNFSFINFHKNTKVFLVFFFFLHFSNIKHTPRQKFSNLARLHKYFKGEKREMETSGHFKNRTAHPF